MNITAFFINTLVKTFTSRSNRSGNQYSKSKQVIEEGGEVASKKEAEAYSPEGERSPSYLQ